MAESSLIAETSAIMAGVINDSCDWCGEVSWVFRCAMCDPRTIKRVCRDCATRWHSRGFSQEHLLEDRAGTKKTYLTWQALILSDPDAGSTAANGKTTEVKQANVVPSPAKKTLYQATTEAPKKNDSTTKVDEIVGETASEGTPEELQVIQKDGGDREREQVNIEYGSGREDGEDGEATQEEVPQEIPAPDETQLDLEDVLDRLPSQDAPVLDALADHIHSAIRIEDASLCDQYIKCEAPSCERQMLHYRHVKDRKMCSDSLCQTIASYHAHIEFCERQDCPFCVRIQQRRLFGKKFGLDKMIQRQRRQLQAFRRENAADQARINFLNDQIAACTRRKQNATEEVEKLNQLAVSRRLPMFNFPPFAWHIPVEPVMKVGAVKSAEPAIDVSAEPANAEDKENRIEATDTADASLGLGPNADLDSPPPESPKADYVASLIEKKRHGDAVAIELLEESVRHAYRIVDASFCSSSKAARCLLNCQTIHLHLQHHVDSGVCEHKMCETVEHHFAHVSKCQSEETDKTCEYCLRVTEREFARAVEMMEAEKSETEFKIQHLIRGLTESYSNDPLDERKENVMQLEDELQQAEEYKKALMRKLDTASLNLVKSRRRMKKHPAQLSSSYTTGLPLHFIKIARHGSPSKRRKP